MDRGVGIVGHRKGDAAGAEPGVVEALVGERQGKADHIAEEGEGPGEIADVQIDVADDPRTAGTLA